VLKDGTKVLIKSLPGTENAQEFQRFINTFTKEGAYYLLKN